MRVDASFWTNVEKRAPDECWPWLGCVTVKGYGRFHEDLGPRATRHTRAHRIAYRLSIGPIPAGLLVLHNCDNPPCCNPAHLRLGTNDDNQAEKRVKGRARNQYTAAPFRKPAHDLAPFGDGTSEGIGLASEADRTPPIASPEPVEYAGFAPTPASLWDLVPE